MLDTFIPNNKSVLDESISASAIIALDSDMEAMSNYLQHEDAVSSSLLTLCTLSETIKYYGLHSSIISAVNQDNTLSSIISRFPSVEALGINGYDADHQLVVATTENLLDFIREKSQILFTKIKDVGSRLTSRLMDYVKVGADKIKAKMDGTEQLNFNQDGQVPSNGISAKKAMGSILAIIAGLTIVRKIGATPLTSETISRWGTMLNTYKMGILKLEKGAADFGHLKSTAVMIEAKRLGWSGVIWKGFKAQFWKMVQVCKETITSTIKWFWNLPSSISAIVKSNGGGVSGIFGVIRSIVTSTMRVIWNVIKNLFMIAKAIFGKVWATIRNVFTKSGTPVKAATEAETIAAKEAVDNATESADKVVKELDAFLEKSMIKGDVTVNASNTSVYTADRFMRLKQRLASIFRHKASPSTAT